MTDRPEAGTTTVIVLAAQRTGVVNPLAARAGVSHKALVPICGRALIEHVIETLTTLPSIAAIRVVLEPEGQRAVDPVLEPFRARGIPIELVDSDPNIVESVLAAAGSDEGPFVITTADNVLLTHEGFEGIRRAMKEADGVIGLTTRDRVWAVHEAGQRGFYEFRDDGYANCNIYGLANRKAFAAAEAFREGGQFMANRGRMIRAFGLFNIVLMGLKLIPVHAAMDRIGKRFGIVMKAQVFTDGALAIDVDNERTYAICEWVLGQRLGLDIPKPIIPADA